MGEILDHQPVRDYLIPAARSFLEARRCSPDLALSHARLASLDYLIERGESTSVHAARALRMSGYDHLVLGVAAQAAVQAGDLDLAARCWRKSLAINKYAWKETATVAAMSMKPEQILHEVLPPGGRYPLLLADQLYAAPEWREARDLFLKAALERLNDDDATPAERLWLEGQIRARLDEHDPARKLMIDALVEDPTHPEWREEFIDWLVNWGDFEEASRQARIGLTLHPDHPGIQRALQSALDASARGVPATASQR
jgi:tetratricopeptide (TPR) repeat protein